ncbi:hypothetical protein [Dehalogenimonas formicexedens]|uniref:hypothetical protein n=1 Tax=Dehalogenimonas formicexedens TaxID=1839801 RepID=UPI0011AB5E5C|nr:hypothetical protein [Dehalogenimonas formicexedens]
MNIVKKKAPEEQTMGVMISIILLLIAAVVGAWRLETDFDRENRSAPALQTVKRANTDPRE